MFGRHDTIKSTYATKASAGGRVERVNISPAVVRSNLQTTAVRVVAVSRPPKQQPQTTPNKSNHMISVGQHPAAAGRAARHQHAYSGIVTPNHPARLQPHHITSPATKLPHCPTSGSHHQDGPSRHDVGNPNKQASTTKKSDHPTPQILTS